MQTLVTISNGKRSAQISVDSEIKKDGSLILIFEYGINNKGKEVITAYSEIPHPELEELSDGSFRLSKVLFWDDPLTWSRIT